MNREILIDALEDLDSGLIERYFEIKEKLRKRKTVTKSVMRWTAAAACFLLAVTAIYGAVDNIGTTSPGGVWEKPSDLDDIIWLEDDGGAVTGESAGEIWNGLRVSYDLGETLRKADDGVWLAMHIFNNEDLKTFEYNGKTYEEHRKELHDLRLLPRILDLLLKEGETLKYGELIYTEGLPDGTKWSKQLYDSRIEFYGEEMLEKYIADGVLLTEKINNDISEAEKKIEAMEEMTEEILKAYRAHEEEKLYEIFDEAGYFVTVKNDALYLFITKQAFAELDIENAEDMIFSLASRSAFEGKVTAAPTVEITRSDDVEATDAAIQKFHFEPDKKTINDYNDIVDALNEIIEKWKYATDSFELTVYCTEGTATDGLFNNLNYTSLNKAKYPDRTVIRIAFADIDIDALMKLAESEKVTSIIVTVPMTPVPA